MKIIQKRVRAKTIFAFGDTELTYSIRVGSAVQEQVFDYFEIQRPRRHTATRDWSRLQLSLLLAALGACAALAQLRYGGPSPALGLWFLPSLAWLAIFTFSQSHFVEFQAAGRPVWIIDDKSTHRIVAEIDRRRRDRLATLYGDINLANEPATEIRKIEWLVGEAVLTRDEADLQIVTVNAAAEARRKQAEEAELANSADFFRREAIAV